jgi:acetate kinase
MKENNEIRVLTINSGSSSLKAGVYHMMIPENQAESQDLGRAEVQKDYGKSGVRESLSLSAEVDRIGIPGSRLKILDEQGETLLDKEEDLDDHHAALRALFAWIEENKPHLKPDAVGHRIVHGGQNYSQPQILTQQLLDELKELIPLDPEHLPQALDGIHFIHQEYPDLPQTACFDTAFHRQMPKRARLYALPRQFFEQGVQRYGFHGLSYEYILQELQDLDGQMAQGRVIIAHLGNGASVAAVKDGKSIDTSMGFTPLEGLVMGTRCGDLDPGIMIYLLEEKKMSAEQINTLINNKSGLLGVSNSSEDMKDLLQKEAKDPHAAEAVELFCYRLKKYIGAYAAALGGLDILVFTGGIGEHASVIRQRVCEGLEFLGIMLNPERNQAGKLLISDDQGRVRVRVIKTEEDLMIAKHTARLIKRG